MSATRENIEALRNEAATAGDTEQVEICTMALEGNVDAWAKCEYVIAETQAQ